MGKKDKKPGNEESEIKKILFEYSDEEVDEEFKNKILKARLREIIPSVYLNIPEYRDMIEKVALKNEETKRKLGNSKFFKAVKSLVSTYNKKTDNDVFYFTSLFEIIETAKDAEHINKLKRLLDEYPESGDIVSFTGVLPEILEKVENANELERIKDIITSYPLKEEIDSFVWILPRLLDKKVNLEFILNAIKKESKPKLFLSSYKLNEVLEDNSELIEKTHIKVPEDLQETFWDVLWHEFKARYLLKRFGGKLPEIRKEEIKKPKTREEAKMLIREMLGRIKKMYEEVGELIETKRKKHRGTRKR